MSHSSRDAGEVVRLAEVLRKKISNAYPIFCSSDHQSIPPGDDWFDYMKIALRRCKLMFCFTSSHSQASAWVAFEAGFAFARRIPIIPVSIKSADAPIPGSPLSMPQGFKLGSASDLKRLIREINRHFGGSTTGALFSGRFSPKEFEHIFHLNDSAKPFPEESLELIEAVSVELRPTASIRRGLATLLPEADMASLEKGRAVKHRGLQLRYPEHEGGLLRIEFSLKELEDQTSVFNDLIPELQLSDLPIAIQVKSGAKLLTPGSERSAKLASFVIHSSAKGKYQFSSLTFDLDSSQALILCDMPPPLMHSAILELVSKLRRSGVLYVS